MSYELLGLAGFVQSGIGIDHKRGMKYTILPLPYFTTLMNMEKHFRVAYCHHRI
jgi:hypothetical protein